MSAYSEMDRLMASLRLRLPGATDAAIALELFNTIDEHLRETNAWVNEQEIAITANTTDYPLSAPAGTELVRVLYVTHNGRPLSPTPAGAATLNVGEFPADSVAVDFDGEFTADVLVSPGGVTQYSVFYPTYITINVPSEDAAQYPLMFAAAITLSPSVLESGVADPDTVSEWALDEWLYPRYFQDWLDGTLGKMMSHPTKPYSNPQLSLFHMKKFQKAKAFAAQEARRGFVYNRPVWSFPRFGV